MNYEHEHNQMSTSFYLQHNIMKLDIICNLDVHIICTMHYGRVGRQH